MNRWRRRLARWLVGPYVAFTESGSWLVTRDAENDTTVTIPIAEWSGTFVTDLEPRRFAGASVEFPPRTPGSFSGTFQT